MLGGEGVIKCMLGLRVSRDQQHGELSPRSSFVASMQQVQARDDTIT